MSSSAAVSPDHHLPLPSEQLCYIRCDFCDSLLAVNVPRGSLFTNVTVKCGRCTNLMSVNFPASDGAVAANTAANQFHVGRNFFSRRNIMEEMRKTPSNLLINQLNPNERFAPVRADELSKSLLANRPLENCQREPSPFNRSIKEELLLIKAEIPGTSHEEAFISATKNEREDDVLMKDGFSECVFAILRKVKGLRFK